MLFEYYPDIERLYMPLIGRTMLELGNKKVVRHERTVLLYKDYFESLGMQHTSVDLNGEDGALALDLRQPLGLGTFDMVCNMGCSEHVTDQVGCWRNVLEAMHVGSVLASSTPLPGDWSYHGFYHPSVSWYEELARLNGLEVEELYVFDKAPRRSIGIRAKRVEDRPFTMPTLAIHRTRARG